MGYTHDSDVTKSKMREVNSLPDVIDRHICMWALVHCPRPNKHPKETCCQYLQDNTVLDVFYQGAWLLCDVIMSGVINFLTKRLPEWTMTIHPFNFQVLK